MPRPAPPPWREALGAGMGTGTLFSIILPVFGLIAVGWLAVATKVLRPEVGDALSDFVFVIAIPVLLFRALGTLALPDIDPWRFWACYFLGVAAVWTLGSVAIRTVFRRDARTGVIAGVSAAFSNLVFMGLPVFQRAYGSDGLLVGLVLVAVHLPVMMTVAVVLIDLAERRDGTRSTRSTVRGTLARLVRSLGRNPLVIGILAGVAFRLTGLPLPALAVDVIDKIDDTAIPLALIALGMSLHRYGIAGNLAPAIAITTIKLMVAPAIVLLLATHVFGLPPLVTAIATLAAASPTGVNAWLIANHFQTGHALASNAIAIATVSSILTFSFWLWVLGAQI